MSKKNKKKVDRQEKNKGDDRGLFYGSPLFLGLKSLVPVFLVVVVSILALKSTQGSDKRALMKSGEEVASPLAHQELAKKAALANDYKLARREYMRGLNLISDESAVLGWESELEAAVFPKENLKSRIEVWLEQVKKTASREIYLKIAIGYWKLGNYESSFEYWEKASKLDPNDRQVLEVKELYN